MTYVLVIIIVILIAALPITWKAAIDRKTKDDAAKIGTAEEKARVIIDDALKTAETKKREALLEVKEQSLAAKNENDNVVRYYLDLLDSYFLKGKYPTEQDDAGVAYNPEDCVFKLMQK